MVLTFRVRGALEECSALRKDGFKCINVILGYVAGTCANARELNANESASIGTHVPAGNQITVRRLVKDLCSRWYRKVELRWEV
eukprot:CAMPEP_0178947170 /NCGR_PEP_ID=MMETSP0789-20121207/4697_1 /TAXON_ID=3005 /ORGANISM="Rhizosolenia setigera, Strain CCMP 1694" /LENGTH=83 /DNA_ID=CAMNT_0020627253 /DNA_START=365 /DNA_END=616 /DNA_ORIENTATION=+